MAGKVVDEGAVFTDLIKALVEFKDLCTYDERQPDLPEIEVDAVKEAYERHFPCEPRHRSAYDRAVYPSLFSDLRILEGGRGLSAKQLPKEWTPKAARKALQNNPLAAFLAAVTWKQRDFGNVALVLHGIKATDEPSAGQSAVLYQFGRHLAHPLHEPIFDKHVHCARYLFDAVSRMGSAVTDLAEFKKRCTVGDREALFRGKGTDGAELKSYRRWWARRVAPRLPSPDGARAEAILWVDRWLFSLGKEAAAVLPREKSAARRRPAGL